MFARYKPDPAISLPALKDRHSTCGGDSSNGKNMMQFRKDWVFFFDIDGTLADIAPKPDAAQIPFSTLNDLLFLQKKTALALVSGRNLSSIDALTAPLKFPAAGQHGLEIRFGGGEVFYKTRHKPVMDAIGEEVRRFASAHPALVVEYKGLSVAIHYRQAPALGAPVKDFVQALAKTHETLLCLQQGKMVEEIKLRGGNKGTAIAAFMRTPDFAGKIPVFAGDDKTDEDAHAMVNKLGGVSIQIGSSSRCAHFNLGSPHNLRAWINDIVTNWEVEK